MTHRLLVNPDTSQQWEIPLPPGTTRIGRRDGNDYKIDHTSVSGTHCEVIVDSMGGRVKDLGSINGTFVDDTQVQEAVLLPGQMLRLGEVVMRYGVEPQPAIGGNSAATTSPAKAGVVCKSHPKIAARYYCAKCREGFCGLCVNTRMANGRPAKFCRACGGECAPLPSALTQTQEAPTFVRLVGGAFAYPFKHDGTILLVAGTVFYSLMDLLARFSGFFGIVLMIIGTGYLISYLQRILVASATGEDQMPDWPDFSGWDDVAGPCIQFLGVVAVAFGPAIALKIFAPADAPWLGWAYPAAIILGCIYFPMGFTAVAMFDSLGALNPFLIIISILKIPATYLLAVLLLLAGYAAAWLGNKLLESALPLPILPGLISKCLGLYLLIVEMRILGLLYRTKKSELGWFKR